MWRKFKPRISFWKAALWRPGRGRRFMSSLVWVLGLIGILRSEFLPAAQQDSSRILIFIPRLAWYWWVLGILTFTLFSVMEGAYRIYTKKVGELNKEKEQLTTDLNKSNVRVTDLTTTLQKRNEDFDTLQIQWKFRGDDIEKLEENVRVLQSELDSLKAYKLKFEVDATRSQVSVDSHPYEEFNITLQLYIRFENSDIHPCTVRSVNVLLMKRNEDDAASAIPLTEQRLYTILVENDKAIERRWENRNLSINGRELTLYHVIDGYISVSGDYREILDSNCFLRVTMDAMNQ